MREQLTLDDAIKKYWNGDTDCGCGGMEIVETARKLLAAMKAERDALVKRVKVLETELKNTKEAKQLYMDGSQKTTQQVVDLVLERIQLTDRVAVLDAAVNIARDVATRREVLPHVYPDELNIIKQAAKDGEAAVRNNEKVEAPK